MSDQLPVFGLEDLMKIYDDVSRSPSQTAYIYDLLHERMRSAQMSMGERLDQDLYYGCTDWDTPEGMVRLKDKGAKYWARVRWYETRHAERYIRWMAKGGRPFLTERKRR